MRSKSARYGEDAAHQVVEPVPLFACFSCVFPLSRGSEAGADGGRHKRVPPGITGANICAPVANSAERRSRSLLYIYAHIRAHSAASPPAPPRICAPDAALKHLQRTIKAEPSSSYGTRLLRGKRRPLHPSAAERAEEAAASLLHGQMDVSAQSAGWDFSAVGWTEWREG